MSAPRRVATSMASLVRAQAERMCETTRVCKNVASKGLSAVPRDEHGAGWMSMDLLDLGSDYTISLMSVSFAHCASCAVFRRDLLTFTPKPALNLHDNETGAVTFRCTQQNK